MSGFNGELDQYFDDESLYLRVMSRVFHSKGYKNFSGYSNFSEVDTLQHFFYLNSSLLKLELTLDGLNLKLVYVRGLIRPSIKCIRYIYITEFSVERVLEVLKKMDFPDNKLIVQCLTHSDPYIRVLSKVLHSKGYLEMVIGLENCQNDYCLSLVRDDFYAVIYLYTFKSDFIELVCDFNEGATKIVFKNQEFTVERVLEELENIKFPDLDIKKPL